MSTQIDPLRYLEAQIIDGAPAVIELADMVELDHRRSLADVEQGEDGVDGEREHDGRQHAEHHQVDRVLSQSLEDECAEAAGADQRGDDGKPDRLNAHDAQAGENDREGQR